MREIDTRNFVRATRSTPRAVNRQILLNLVREHEPISRADLSRRMEIARGMITSLVDELVIGAVQRHWWRRHSLPRRVSRRCRQRYEAENR